MQAEEPSVLGEFQMSNSGALLKFAGKKIHKTWLQEVFVFQIVPPLIVLHVATISPAKAERNPARRRVFARANYAHRRLVSSYRKVH